MAASELRKISVISIVKNNKMGLLRTLESLLAQKFTHWECIIVVGESVDGSIQLASEYAERDYRFKVIIQKDHGIYEAMNQGLLHAFDEYVWFMNSGDSFAHEFVMLDAFKKMEIKDIGFIVGGYRIQNDNRQFIQKNCQIKRFYFTFSRRGGCHQAILFRRVAIQSAENFNIKYRLAADHQLCLKIIKKYGAESTSEIYASMEPNGRTDLALRQMHNEKQNIRAKEFRYPIVILFIGYFWKEISLLKFSLRAGISRAHQVRSE